MKPLKKKPKNKTMMALGSKMDNIILIWIGKGSMRFSNKWYQNRVQVYLCRWISNKIVW